MGDIDRALCSAGTVSPAIDDQQGAILSRPSFLYSCDPASSPVSLVPSIAACRAYGRWPFRSSGEEAFGCTFTIPVQEVV
jgi:hypothetical protein